MGLDFNVHGDLDINSTGMKLNASVSLNADLTSMLHMNASGSLTIDTQAPTHVFKIAMTGDLVIATVFTVHGSFDIEIGTGGANTWHLGVDLNASVGPLTIHAGGWIQSDGQFDLTLSGGVSFGIAGLSIDGNLSGELSLTKSGTNYVYRSSDTYTLNAQLSGNVEATIHGYGFGLGLTIGGTAVMGSGSTTLSLYASACYSTWIHDFTAGGTIATITIPASILPPVPPRLASLDDTGKLQLNVGGRSFL